MKNIIKILKELKIGSPYPWWEWDLEKGKFKFNSGRDILFHFNLDKFLNLYYLNNSKSSISKFKKIKSPKNHIFNNFFKLKDESGGYKWYLDLYSVLKKNKEGKPKIVRGFLIDLERFFENGFIDENEVVMVCSYCGKIKMFDLKWIEVPKGVLENIKNKISHSLCNKCLKIFYD
jgi:hypothetical protein